MLPEMFHIHVATVTLFLFFFIFKTILLFLSKKNLLQSIRSKTKMADILLGIFTLVSGLYLLTATPNIERYLIVKVVLVLFAIPLGIVALKRENKRLATLTLLLFVYIYGVAETKSLVFQKQNFEMAEFQEEINPDANIILEANESAALQQGKVIYKVLCVECHGEEGDLAPESAANLNKSKLSLEEKVLIITNGKGVMPGYDSELSEQEVELVAAYTETLK